MKTRLDNFAAHVETDVHAFDVAATNGLTHTLVARDLVVYNLTPADLIGTYDRMVQGPGRDIYEELRSSSPRDECPFCSHRDVTTLDHYLPKTSFPVLSVAPVNLVPSCSDCNKEKLEKIPGSAEEVLWHPYFDSVEDDVWLKGTVRHTSPPSIMFEADPPETWPNLLAARIKNHFSGLKLANLYSTQAARLIIEIKLQVKDLYTKGGTAELKNYLHESAASRAAVNLNSWQSASYRALADSDWYCTGGFN